MAINIPLNDLSSDISSLRNSLSTDTTEIPIEIRNLFREEDKTGGLASLYLPDKDNPYCIELINKYLNSDKCPDELKSISLFSDTPSDITIEQVLLLCLNLSWSSNGNHNDSARFIHMISGHTFSDILSLEDPHSSETNCSIFNESFKIFFNLILSHNPELRAKYILIDTHSEYSVDLQRGMITKAYSSPEVQKRTAPHVFLSLLTFSKNNLNITAIDPYHTPNHKPLARSEDAVSELDFSDNRGIDGYLSALYLLDQNKEKEGLFRDILLSYSGPGRTYIETLLNQSFEVVDTGTLSLADKCIQISAILSSTAIEEAEEFLKSGNTHSALMIRLTEKLKTTGQIDRMYYIEQETQNKKRSEAFRNVTELIDLASTLRIKCFDLVQKFIQKEPPYNSDELINFLTLIDDIFVYKFRIPDELFIQIQSFLDKLIEDSKNVSIIDADADSRLYNRSIFDAVIIPDTIEFNKWLNFRIKRFTLLKKIYPFITFSELTQDNRKDAELVNLKRFNEAMKAI